MVTQEESAFRTTISHFALSKHKYRLRKIWQPILYSLWILPPRKRLQDDGNDAQATQAGIKSRPNVIGNIDKKCYHEKRKNKTQQNMFTTSVLAHGILEEVKFTRISWPPLWKDRWNCWHHCYPGKKQIKETPSSLWLPQKQRFRIPIRPGNSGQEENLRDMSTAKSHYYYYHFYY